MSSKEARTIGADAIINYASSNNEQTSKKIIDCNDFPETDKFFKAFLGESSEFQWLNFALNLIYFLFNY